MKWILGKKNIDINTITIVECNLKIKFPKEYKTIVLEYNGASPEVNTFDTDKTKGRVAEYLLSFSLEEKMNIIETYEILKDRLPNNIIPVISDPFGNYICFDFTKNNVISVVFWNHENNSIERVSDSFNDFIQSLY